MLVACINIIAHYSKNFNRSVTINKTTNSSIESCQNNLELITFNKYILNKIYNKEIYLYFGFDKNFREK